MVKKYELMISKALKFWGSIAKKNDWSINKRGVTVWVSNNKVVDSYVNPSNNNDKSFVVDYESDKILYVCEGGL